MSSFLLFQSIRVIKYEMCKNKDILFYAPIDPMKREQAITVLVDFCHTKYKSYIVIHSQT